jgi:uncharacterized protein YoxC
MEWFGAAMDDDNGLTAQEVEEFNKRYAQMVEDVNRKMEAINQAGIDISGSKDGSTALTGAIKGITESTASLLAGQMNGIRINVVQQLERMGAILTAVQGIKNDTGQYLPYLQSINAGIASLQNGMQRGV